MPPVNPVSGLPTYAAERLSESGDQSGRRDERASQDKKKKQPADKFQVSDNSEPNDEIVQVSQPIESEKVVELMKPLKTHMSVLKAFPSKPLTDPTPVTSTPKIDKAV